LFSTYRIFVTRLPPAPGFCRERWRPPAARFARGARVEGVLRQDSLDHGIDSLAVGKRQVKRRYHDDGEPRQFSEIFWNNLHAIAFEHKRKRESYFALAGQK